MNPRRNPLSEDGMVVNPRRKNGFVLVYLPGHQGRKMAIRDANSRDVQKGEALTYEEAMRIAKLNGAEDVVDQSSHATSPRNNPRRKGAAKRSGGRTAAQGNAAKAMKLYHSGQASSLAEAWQMVRGSSARRNPLSEDGMVVSNPRAYPGERYVYVLNHLNTSPGLRHIAEALANHTDADFDFIVKSKDGKTAKAILQEGLDTGLITTRKAGDFADEVRQVLRARRGNPLSEDGAVVSNPRRKGGAKPSAKRSGGRTAAQGNAAKAMKLFHSGKASSLAEAWDMVRRGR
jgi:hypothetical protein